MFGGVQLSTVSLQLLQRLSKKRAACTFDEITVGDLPVEFHPNDVCCASYVTRRIKLKGCGILSAAMDTVTEKTMALAMAKMGGMGIIHRNLSPKEQLEQVRWVRLKIHHGGMIENPLTFGPTQRVSVVQHSIKNHGWTFTSFPVVDSDGKLVGLLTRDQMDFIEATNPVISDIMLKITEIVTANKHTTTDEAYNIMKTCRVKKLPIIDENSVLIGMYVWNDVKGDQRRKNLFSLDSEGHFLVGAAIGVGAADLERAKLLVDRGCKVIVIDSSHGACKPVKDQITALRELYGETIDIIAGNIASYESARYLLTGPALPDALKVGIGPGSICTTREVTGHGVPQITAIYECWKAASEIGSSTGYHVPLISDGGIRNSGDIVKCFAVGASAIMLGSVLAGTEESPGKLVFKHGRRFKSIRGMGSRAAMEESSGSRGRYYRETSEQHSEVITVQQANKVVPEGVEGLVEYKGDVETVMTHLVGGVQAGFAHSGSLCVQDFQRNAQLWLQSLAGVTEGRPHDITDISK